MKALRIVMGTVACLLTVVTLLLAFASFYVFEPKRFEADIFTEEFYDAVLLHRDKALDELESVVAVEREELLGFFDDAECKALAEKYVRALLNDVLVGGNSIESVAFDSAELEAFIHGEFKKYDFSETEYGDSESAAVKACEMVNAKLTTAVCFTPQNYVQKALRYVAGVRDGVSALSSFWYLPAVIAVLLYVGMFLLKRDLTGLFMPSAFLWCACALVFIPAAMLYFGDVASTLELSKNQLYYFLFGVLTTVKNGIFITTVIPFAIATVTLALASFFKSASQND